MNFLTVIENTNVFKRIAKLLAHDFSRKSTPKEDLKIVFSYMSLSNLFQTKGIMIFYLPGMVEF